MAYVALKPCCFAGQKFLIGEEVPDEVIHPGNAKNLVKMGLIAERNGTTETSEAQAPAPVETMAVCIHAEEGDLPLELTQEGLQAVVDVLTSKPAEAEATIGQMTDGDALILLHIAENRKAIKAAAEARAKEINEAENDEGEQ